MRPTTHWLGRARTVIPGAAQTLSKGQHNFVEGVSPAFIASGFGGRVRDIEGREYIDWICGLAAHGLGYNHPAVNAHVVATMTRDDAAGSFSLPTTVEVEVAERLVARIPCADMVRFVKTGSEADSGALRIARAVTGREIWVQCGYSGWHSEMIAGRPWCPGVPEAMKELVRTVPYNDLDAMANAIDSDVAAVIMEPTLLTKPNPGYLEDVRDLCTHFGTVLIFDEIVTGFRWALAGGQEYFKVTPDLATFGKALANGFPLAAIVGKRELMTDAARFVSGTFGGETVALHAAQAVIDTYEHDNVIPYLWRIGQSLIDAITPSLSDAGFAVTGYPVHWKIEPPSDSENPMFAMSLLVQECAKRGVLIHHGGNNVCAMHVERDVEHTGRIVAHAVEALEHGVELEGPPIAPAFLRVTQ